MAAVVAANAAVSATICPDTSILGLGVGASAAAAPLAAAAAEASRAAASGPDAAAAGGGGGTLRSGPSTTKGRGYCAISEACAASTCQKLRIYTQCKLLGKKIQCLTCLSKVPYTRHLKLFKKSEMEAYNGIILVCSHRD